jgi:4-alpha-glucanotransferase
MSEPTEQLLSTLAERAGIASDYYDISGAKHITTGDTKRAILSAMGFVVRSSDDLSRALREWDEAPWRRACDPVRVVRKGADLFITCCLALEDGQESTVVLQWKILDEAGAFVTDGEAGPGLRPSRCGLSMAGDMSRWSCVCRTIYRSATIRLSYRMRD